VDIGVLEGDYSTESDTLFPTFVIPNKNWTICVVTNFRKFNVLLKCHSFPMPKIGEMIRSIEELTFVSDLDLNMDHYHIKLDSDTQNICRIAFPWHVGRYKYKRLPICIKIAPDIFQNIKSQIISGMRLNVLISLNLSYLQNNQNIWNTGSPEKRSTYT
jgi:hypothetical protein